MHAVTEKRHNQLAVLASNNVPPCIVSGRPSWFVLTKLTEGLYHQLMNTSRLKNYVSRWYNFHIINTFVQINNLTIIQLNYSLVRKKAKKKSIALIMPELTDELIRTRCIQMIRNQ